MTKGVENGAWLPDYGALAANGRMMRGCRLRLPVPGNIVASGFSRTDSGSSPDRTLERRL